MTACISGNPAYCVYPAAGENGKPPQIRILVEGPAFAIPAMPVVLDRDQGLDMCDRLNRRLGRRDRAAWTVFAARCLRAAASTVNGGTLHRPAPDAVAVCFTGCGRGVTAPVYARVRPGVGEELSRGERLGGPEELFLRPDPRAQPQEKKMYDFDHDTGTVTGRQMLAEIGIDPRTVREVNEDDRMIRCPERGTVFPVHGFAGLVPDPAAE